MDRPIPTNLYHQAPKVQAVKAPRVTKPKAAKVIKPKTPKVTKPKTPKVTKPRVPKRSKVPITTTPEQEAASVPLVKEEDDSDGELFVQDEQASAQPHLMTPPVDDETKVTLALNAVEDMRSRVVRKEQCAAMGISAVRKLKALLQKDEKSYHEGSAFVEQCDQILEMDKLPRILVGVLGYTGAGKSSLINALVEQETIVPCNAMRASTSVAVEISYNESNDPKAAFRAEVEFVTAEEWFSEAEILFSDIKNRPAAESLTLNSNTDAGLAFAKLSAIYPGISISKLVEGRPDELEGIRDISDYLGQTCSIQEPNAAKFSKAVHKYIDSSNKATGSDEFACWPLVRLVKVYIKSDILKHGLVLVDLPGLGDSNAGRTQVAEEYIKRLRHMWIVADIVRAIDDRVANELMSRSFKRALLMDGKYSENFVTMIMTKTDQLTTHEVINSLDLASGALKEEVEQETQLQDELQTLKDQVNDQRQIQKQCKKALRKRTHEESEPLDDTQQSERQKEINAELDGASAAETKLNAQVSAVKKAISALNTKMKTICIRERNRYTSNHLQQDFRTGKSEMLEELEAGGRTRRVSAEEGTLTTSLNTFCVSSAAYQQAQGRFRRNNSIKGFSLVEDTQIPSLRSFAEQCTLADRETVVDTILTELNLFKFSLELWAQNRGTQPQLSMDQRRVLKIEVDNHFKKVKSDTEKFRNMARNSILGSIRTHIGGHLIEARIKGCSEAQAICAKIDVAFSTWRAICRRKGARYSTGKKVIHHWNEELLEAFIGPLTKYWNRLFQNRIPKQNVVYAARIIESLRSSQKEIHGLVTRICGKYNLSHMALKQVPILEDQIKASVMEALKAGQHEAQDAHRAIGAIISEHMLPYYVVNVEVGGKGALKTLKQNLKDFLKDNSQAMYQAASDSLDKKLDDMRLELSAKLFNAARQAQIKLRKDIMKVISLGGVDEKSKKSIGTAELREQVQRGLEAMEKAWLEIVESPEELRAEDPFAKIATTSESDDEDEDGGHSDVSSDASESEAEQDSASSEEDNDDSGDEDFKA